MQAPVSAYSFDDETFVDEIGDNDPTTIENEAYTLTAMHGPTAFTDSGAGGATVYFDPLTTPFAYPISAAFWLYVPTEAVCEPLSLTKTGTGSLLRILIDMTASPGAMLMCTNGDVGGGEAQGDDPTLDAWNFIACGTTEDTGVGQLWVSVNGGTSAVSSVLSPNALLDADEAKNDLGAAPGVILDTLVLWDSTLSSDDLTWLYNEGAGRDIAAILAYTEPAPAVATPASRVMIVPRA